MSLLLFSGSSGYAQFIAVLVVFVLVLGVTAFTTKWIASYQKQQGAGGNIEVIETSRIANNKYIQIVRAGEKYFVIAVCKDTVTMLCEIQGESLRQGSPSRGLRFREILDRVTQKSADVYTQDIPEEPKESEVHDEH